MLDVQQFAAASDKKEYIYLLDTARVIHYILRKFTKLDDNNEARQSTVKILANVASTVTELAKSALIDVELRRFSQSAVAISLWAVALDVKLDENGPMDNQEAIGAIIEIWERLVLEMLGQGAMAKIEKFGWYLLLRQKCIFEVYGQKADCINKIYNSNSFAIYDSKCVNEQFDV